MYYCNCKGEDKFLVAKIIISEHYDRTRDAFLSLSIFPFRSYNIRLSKENRWIKTGIYFYSENNSIRHYCPLCLKPIQYNYEGIEHPVTEEDYILCINFYSNFFNIDITDYNPFKERQVSGSAILRNHLELYPKKYNKIKQEILNKIDNREYLKISLKELQRLVESVYTLKMHGLSTNELLQVRNVLKFVRR